MGKKGLFDIVNNVQPSGTTTLDNLDINGLNFYETQYEPGSIIGYTLKGTMSAAKTNAYWAASIDATSTGNAGFKSAVYPNATFDIDYYELVYWGADSRSGDTVRMSGTLLIPKVLNSNVIVSYKHGTITSTSQNSTLWSVMYNFDNNTGGNTIFAQNSAWTFATEGYVVIIADNPSYGISVGPYNYADPYGEVISQYGAVVATSQLTQKAPELFPTVFDPEHFEIINTGFSLGAIFAPIVSQVIMANSPANKLYVINTIAGSPVNAYELFNWGIYNNAGTISSYGTSLPVLVFFILFCNGDINSIPAEYGLKDVMTTGLLPMFNQLYLNTPANVGYAAGGALWLARIIDKTNNAAAGAITTPFAPLPLQIVDPTKVWDAKKGLLDNIKQTGFYNNIFVDYTPLANTPINVLYNMQDEVCCYDYNWATSGIAPFRNPYTGAGPTTDLVDAPLEAFITTTAPGGNGLNRDSATLWSKPAVTTLTDGTTTTAYIAANAARMLESESTNKCSSYRTNTTGVGLTAGSHSSYSTTILQAVIRKYLQTRL